MVASPVSSPPPSREVGNWRGTVTRRDGFPSPSSPVIIPDAVSYRASGDIQRRCGLLHYAYLASLDIAITCAPSPCGRLSRPPWWDVTPTTTPLSDFPFAVIRRAFPCGCILAGLSPSPFHHCSFATCNALGARGARRPLTPSSLPPVTTFTPSGQGSALPLTTPLLWVGASRGSVTRPAGLLAPWTDSTWGCPRPPGLLLRGFRSMGHLLRTSGMTTVPYRE